MQHYQRPNALGSVRVSAERLDPFAASRPDVVLGHAAVFVGKQLLGVGQVAGIRRSLGSNVAKLKTDLRQFPRLVESRPQC